MGFTFHTHWRGSSTKPAQSTTLKSKNNTPTSTPSISSNLSQNNKHPNWEETGLLGRVGAVRAIWNALKWWIILQQQMMRHRKFHLIRQYGHGLRLRKMRELELNQEKQYAQYFLNEDGPHQSSPPQPEQEIEEESEEEAEMEEEDAGEFSVADYISMLSKEDRETFKQENPQLPPLFFMTKKEKKRYFQDVNRKFKKVLEKIPQRSSRTKKILKFKNDFEVKPFCDKERVVSVAQAKQFKEQYHQKIHFS